ncbi:unnamed protein product [Leptidea sinapis]|nr:unnamed protein product [Leptidea sinapis]
MLKEIGFTGCARPCCKKNLKSKISKSGSKKSLRPSVPSLPINKAPQRNVTPEDIPTKIDKLKSCCSLCCDKGK